MSVAVPLLNGLVPRVVTPSLNVTVPVALEGETVAVRLTAERKVAGLGDEVSVVAAGVWLTVWDRLDDVLAVSLVSPPYDAVNWVRSYRKRGHGERSDATRSERLLPRVVAPSLNVTVPVAVDGETVELSA